MSASTFRRLGSLAVLTGLTLLAGRAPAQFTWTNPAGGNWSVGTNWSGGTAPTPGATTTLTFGDAALAGASYAATNNIADPFTLNGLTFTNNAGSTVTIAPAASGGALNFGGTTPT